MTIDILLILYSVNKDIFLLLLTNRIPRVLAPSFPRHASVSPPHMTNYQSASPFGLCPFKTHPTCSFQRNTFQVFLRCSFTHALLLLTKTFHHSQFLKKKKQVPLPSLLQQSPKLAHISLLPKLQSIADSGQNGLFAVSQTVPILFLIHFTLLECLLLSDHLPFETLQSFKVRIQYQFSHDGFYFFNSF